MNLTKIAAKKLERIDGKLLAGKLSDKPITASSVTTDLLLRDSEVMPLEFNYNNSWDRKANQFTADAKKRYIEADKEYFKLTGTNMSIHSGTRDVYRQAELYIQYNYHGRGNRASWPGCSFHNWGLAADMMRKHESKLVTAMAKGGWKRTVGDEGWHFECTSSPDHARAAQKIKSFRTKKTGLAYKWSEQTALYYQKTKDYNKRAPLFNQRLEKHQANGHQLQAELDRYNNALKRLENRIARYNSDIARFNSDLERAERLYNEIMDMPNGSARNRKIREYNQLAERLEQESNRIKREGNAIDAENAQMSNWAATLKPKITGYEREEAALVKEYQALTKLEKDISSHQKNSANILKQIAQATG